MADVASAEPETGLSTTIVLSLAAVGAAIVSMFGEDGAFTGLNVTMALVGLVPWALVAGGVRVPPWLFLLLAVPPGVIVVAAGNNPGGMFPLMLVVVWLARASHSLLLPTIAASAAFLAILDCTLEKGSTDESGIVYFAGGLGISWLSGAMLRRQEALTRQVRSMRDIEVQRLAADERAHIAREVHDVVAHSLTVVMLNLTGARRALATDPGRADEALARAEVIGRDSLESIRQVMDLLREPAATDALPQPSMDGIPRLVDGYRRAGLDVIAAVAGAPDILDPTVELVAYRLVQESLANVLQHAPGASATVTLAAGADGLDVTVANGAPTSAPAPRSGRAGLGTRGMAERVRTVGGTFEAGPTGDGGWRMSARLPARRLTDELAADRTGEPHGARD